MNTLCHLGRVVPGAVESDVICSIHCHKGVQFVAYLNRMRTLKTNCSIFLSDTIPGAN